jgi:thiol:disulfide interchange protein
VWGQFVQRGRRHKGWARAIAALLVAGAWLYVLEDEVRWRAPIPGAMAEQPIRHDPAGIDWQPWSPEAVAAARAQGRPVLVDFTAQWCLTCQLNRIRSIDIPPVRRKLKAIHAVALIENSLVKNATVMAELERYGRAGVPLVLVYPQDAKAPAIVLPELLTPGIVLGALDQAAK